MEEDRRKSRSDRLPGLQRLLGPESPETVLRYYAGFPADRANCHWRRFLSDQTSQESDQLRTERR
jgi:hypothetical protein